MTAMLEWAIAVAYRDISIDDWEVLDEELCRRVEIVDGLMVPLARVSIEHQNIAANLCDALRAVQSADMAVVTALSVKLRDSPLLLRRPDVVVFRRERLAESVLRAYDVVLAVEVMSPGSMTTDRSSKPAEYAQSGIPHFWRIEQGTDLSLHTYALVPGENVYKMTGVHTLHYVADEPFEINIDIQDLLND